MMDEIRKILSGVKSDRAQGICTACRERRAAGAGMAVPDMCSRCSDTIFVFVRGVIAAFTEDEPEPKFKLAPPPSPLPRAVADL